MKVKLCEIFSPSPHTFMHSGYIFALYRLCQLAVISYCSSNYILKSFAVSYLFCFSSLVIARNIVFTYIFLHLLLPLENICCALIVFQVSLPSTPGDRLPTVCCVQMTMPLTPLLFLLSLTNLEQQFEIFSVVFLSLKLKRNCLCESPF